jgi:hypothetical protein
MKWRLKIEFRQTGAAAVDSMHQVAAIAMST